MGIDVRKFLQVILIFLVLGPTTEARAVEIRYAFRKGISYAYQYSQQSNSKTAAFTTSHTKNASLPVRNFTIKAIDFQDDAFILDIGDANSTSRRYVRPDGEIKGAPTETGQGVPFFLVFPTGDWKISEKRQVKRELQLGNRSIPAIWNLMLKSIDNEKGLAEIIFAASIKLPDDPLRKKVFTLKGRAIFNLFEGVIHQADWQSLYQFTFSNKEFAVTRKLWDFEQQINYSLLMTGIQE